MKLYYHPVSTTSRPIVLFANESGIDLDYQIVDLFTGAQYQPDYAAINPSSQVPVLEDGDFRLTESSAILKYLADKINSPAYPIDLRKRARVNERMDWFNTQHYREWGYHLIYPQVFPHHVRPTEEGQRATVEWGRAKSEEWIKVLNDNVIGSHKYLCGDTITIADYFGAEILATGDLIGVTYKRFPNVDRWMSTMRALPAWKKTNEATDGFAASLRGKKFVTIN